MRTYKEPKRIDKPRIRDSAIRQLNDAAKFNAIRSAAVSFREEEERDRSNNCVDTEKASTVGTSDQNNHIIKDLPVHTALNKDVSQTESYQTEVVLNTGTVTITEVSAKSVPQDKDSSFSSSLSSIPTDSFISSEGKLSDLDSSGSSSHEVVNSFTKAENRPEPISVMEPMKNDEKVEPKITPSSPKASIADTISEPVKKKSLKQVKPKKDNKEKKSVVNDKIKTKKAPVGPGRKKLVKSSEKNVKGKGKLLKKKKNSVNSDLTDEIGALDLSIFETSGNKTDENSASVSPRSSKRTPKKNRKYHSDEDENGQKMKRSPRAVQKRKLNFNEEDDDDEFEEALLVNLRTDSPEKPKLPAKKRKKIETNVSNNESIEKESNSSGIKDGDKKKSADDSLESVTKVKPKKGKSQKKNKDLAKNSPDNEQAANEEGENLSHAEKKVTVKKKKAVKKKLEDIKENDGEKKDGAKGVKNPNKKLSPKKKPEKDQETGNETKPEDLDVDMEEDIGAIEDSEEIHIQHEKKDQVVISCPLCGHLSRSKSANTRHIKRCVEIPRQEEQPEENKTDENVDENCDDKSEVKDDSNNEPPQKCDTGVEKVQDEEEAKKEKEVDTSFGSTEEEISPGNVENVAEEKADEKKVITVDSILKRQNQTTIFKCENCEYSTPKRAMLGRHLRTHGIFVCLRCNLFYDSKEKLKDHVFSEHRDRADFKLCRKCSRYIRCHEQTIEKHMEDCQGPVPFKCKFCEKEFKYESSLKSHIIRHDPDAPKRFNCPQCSYKSNYKANLKKHTKNIHSSERVRREFKCTYENCVKVFHTEDNLRRHLKFHSDVRNFACPQCPKRFKTSAALRGHLVTHDPTRPFKCNIDGCTRDFRSKKLLKNHLQEFHNMSDKKFPCEFQGCKFAFFKKSHLQRHKVSHTGERRYGCSVCGKAFRHADNLKVHMRQHTNEKPVACHLCSFCCRQKSSLQHHLHRVHGIVPKRKIKPKVSTDPNTENKVLSPLSSEFKENQKDGDSKGDTSFDTKPLTPQVKADNPIDLYEFRSDEEFDEDSVLMPLRQDKTSTPIRQDKISYLHQSSAIKKDLIEQTTKNLDFDDKLSDIIDTQNEDKEDEKMTNECDEKPTKEEKLKPKAEVIEEKQTVTEPKRKKPGRKKKIKEADKDKSPELKQAEDINHDEINQDKKPIKPKGKRGRKPKPKPQDTEPSAEATTQDKEESVPSKPPRKKPGPKPKNKDKPKEIVKVPKKRGPKKKLVAQNTAEEDVETPRKKRKYVRKKKGEKSSKPNSEKKVRGRKKADHADSQDSDEEETIIYSELDQNTANDDDDGEATEIEGFVEEDVSIKSPPVNEPEETKKEDNRDMEDEEKEEKSDIEKVNDVEDKPEECEQTEESDVKVAKEEEEKKGSDMESDRMSSGIDTDFEDDLKPPPAPRPPPVVDSDEGDIESGPDEMDTPGRDFESTPPKSVQNHSVQSLPGRDYESTPRDYESTPPKSIQQPDSVPNYGSVENKNDVLSPPSQNYSKIDPPQREVSMESQNEDRDLSNPVPSNISYPPAESVELPGSVPSNTPQGIQNNGGYGSQSDTAMPEVDKDYLGQYLQQFDSGGRSEDDNSRLNSSVDRPDEHLNIPTSPQNKDLPPLNLSASVPPLNLSTTPDRDAIHNKGADMSNKRMEILACDRQQEDHFQSRSDNSSRNSERIPDNVYDSLSSMNSYLPGSRETPSIFPPTTTSSYVPFSENESILQRQRMTTPFLSQSDPNALQNLHRMADSALSANNPATLLRRPTTVPSREEIFPPPSAVSQTMAQNPFHTSWTTQDVRHPHWSQPSYLQRQSGSTSNPLFPKENYLTNGGFMFETSRRSVAERNMFSGLPQTQRPELPHDTFPGFELSYFPGHGYPSTPALDYTRSSSQSAQKSFDERYRQSATGMSDFRTLPPSSTSDMFRSMNPTFSLDKYMYARNPIYHHQHVGESTNSPFLTHGVPSQHAMFERDYTRGFYHQNNPYSFMTNEKPYAAAAAAASAKMTHPTTPGMSQERDFVTRPNTAAAAAADSQIQDHYRHPMLYNMMNRYFE